ncbi:hypothetical protein NDN11_08520 [Acinetobacter sp. C26M]|uniref:hypothetical protein n=1 Tax=unclassified Acinetobacter TaxID=196816 RepID=UPI002036E72B|nr:MULTISPECIES: hypothetical protein [unclassified Acinetobacter]USA48137.1 hypothetical protein NDN11_08520 [Acinetobacter sp. C26M]USA51617.1 hypothetical protein NDN12_08520 [Acinetobacter sp. C26G]
MKKILILCLAALIVGCDQLPNLGERVAKKHLVEANKKIEEFLVILNDPLAEKDVQKYVLCLNYPKIYKYEFIPATLKLSKEESKNKLMNDLKIMTESYSEKLGINCD